MTSYTINSDITLQNFIGSLREAYGSFKFLRVNVKTGKDRSLPQNAITHAWYEQLARELREESALGWKCYCKLHHGVPIMRAEDEEFRDAYDQVIKGLRYEQKLVAMRSWPVTSIMNKDQLSKYAAAMQDDFRARGVLLEFPPDDA